MHERRAPAAAVVPLRHRSPGRRRRPNSALTAGLPHQNSALLPTTARAGPWAGSSRCPPMEIETRSCLLGFISDVLTTSLGQGLPATRRSLPRQIPATADDRRHSRRPRARRALGRVLGGLGGLGSHIKHSETGALLAETTSRRSPCNRALRGLGRVWGRVCPRQVRQ
jgi:hypothetical protein